MPSGKDGKAGKDAPSPGKSGTSEHSREVDSAHSNAAGAIPNATAGTPVRHSVHAGSLSLPQKPKPTGVPDAAAPSAPVTTSAGDHGTEPTPTPSGTSPKVHVSDPPQAAASASESSAPIGTPAASDAARQSATAALQRSASSRHGAFVRVLDYGVTAEQGIRRTMEDQHVMLAEGIPFFGVYDGHGGTQCAEYLRDNLHTMILGHPEIRTNPEKAIIDSVVKADRDFLERSEAEGSNESGSVCAVALLLDDNLVVGNVGDSEAVLCRNGAPIVLTTKHNPQCNPAEAERVREAGGRIFHNRVGHPKFNPSLVSLAVTRAVGDAGFKLDEYTDGLRSGIIATPDTQTIRISPEDEFLIIGCDGLWDVMSYEEVVDFCGRRFRAGEMAQSITDELAQAALIRGGTDNVTAMLIHLTRRREGTAGPEVVAETAVSTSVRNLSDEA